MSSDILSAINIMATFVHNEPTSLAIIQEAALPEAFYKAIEAGLEPSIEVDLPLTLHNHNTENFQVLQAIPNALGALCLNDVGQTQLARRPSIIPGILSVFTSELHLKVLLDKENSVLLGTAIDELIRHHPSLRTAVFDALRATIAKIEELGSAYEVPEDLRHWYRLVPGSISTVVDGDVAMDVESVASASRSDATVHAEDTQTDILDDDDVDEATNKIQDNHVVSFIDILGRVSGAWNLLFSSC
jgi:E3 ubiquitin-protein ligase HUWE1